MAENKWIIDTPDNKKIYGLLTSPNKVKNNKVILHIHGMGGGLADYAPTRMAMKFPVKGYDVLRISLYSSEKDGRNLTDCTISQFAKDINTVVKSLRKKYNKVYATGHSYGGLSLMASDINQFDAVCLWDPTYIADFFYNKEDFTKLGENYVRLNGYGLILGEKFIDESKEYDLKKAVNLSKKCKIPLQVVFAQWWHKRGASFHTHAKGPTNEEFIKESVHAFYEQGTTEKLLRYVYSWFEKY